MILTDLLPSVEGRFVEGSVGSSRVPIRPGTRFVHYELSVSQRMPVESFDRLFGLSIVVEGYKAKSAGAT